VSPEVVEVLLPPWVHFLKDAAERLLLSVQKACAFSALLLAQVPCDVLSGGEDFFYPFHFLGRFPHGIVGGFCWCKTLQECSDAIIFVVIEELSSCVAMLSNLLLSGVCNWCQSQQSLLFSSIFCLKHFEEIPIDTCDNGILRNRLVA
jgi:hypothetical protein